MNPAKVFIKKRTRENKISLPYIEVLWEAGKKKKKKSKKSKNKSQVTFKKKLCSRITKSK